MRERRIIALAAGLLVALALAACGSSGSGQTGNGLASQSPDQIVAQASKAIDGVSSTRVKGTIGAASARIALDLHLVNGKGATGSLAENGLSFRLITVGDEAYINGSSGFWKQFGGPSAVALLRGKWLRAPADSGAFASFASLTNLHKLLSGLLVGHGALTKASSTTTIDGHQAIALHDASKGGTLYVASTGTPYPLRITSSGDHGGQLDFSAFNAPVTLTAPAASIDISRLQK